MMATHQVCETKICIDFKNQRLNTLCSNNSICSDIIKFGCRLLTSCCMLPKEPLGEHLNREKPGPKHNGNKSTVDSNSLPPRNF